MDKIPEPRQPSAPNPDSSSHVESKTNRPEDAKIKGLTPSPLSARSGAADIKAAPITGSEMQPVSIGLSPSQVGPFQELAVKSQKDTYEKSLTPDQATEYNSKSAEDQNTAVRDWLTDPTRRENNERPRLEMRMCFGQEGMCANVAFCCASGSEREEIYPAFQSSDIAKELHLVKAGSTTIEIASNGVDKSTPIRFLQQGDNFRDVLKMTGYRPGPTIDAMKSGTVIVSDADGTIWDKPAKGMPVETSNLFNSEAKEPILTYLAQGGVLVINTGNDPARTFRRFLPGLAGIPTEQRHAILSRVIIASAGGGSFSAFIDGKPQEIPGYHDFDPSTPIEGAKLDMLYLGDDAKLAGNDMAGFIASEGRYICVAPRSSEKHVADAHLEENVQYGEVKSSHSIFTAVVLQAQANHSATKSKADQPLFSDMPALLANTRNIGPAREITAHTISALGSREELNRVISEEIDGTNPPMRVSAETTKMTMANLPPAKDGEPMTYASVMERADQLPKTPDQMLSKPILEAGNSPSIPSIVNAFLDTTDLVKETSSGVVTLRILEPGNNDQATPMHVASQIKYLREKVAERGGNVDNLHIQVIVMGKGGHATTATFPQIGQMRKTKEGMIFTGTEEAVSLGETLCSSLRESGIPVKVVQTLDGSEDIAGGVSVKLEKTSTNTGQNVKNSIASYKEKRPNYQWVVAATPSSKRQLLTFAHQYEEGDDKCFDELWGMPVMRSPSFVSDSLSDFQATTEFYAGMAEKARLVAYAMNPNPYIPLFTNNPAELQATLDSLYDNYARLEGRSPEEVKESVTIGDLQRYYGGKFSALEQSIPWSKAAETQQAHTKGAVETLTKRVKTARREEVFKALGVLGNYKKHGVDDKTLGAALNNLQSFINKEITGNLYTLCSRVNDAAIAAGILHP